MKPVYFCPDYSDRQGISISFTKTTQYLSISGWYDSMVGIEGAQITLRQFFDKVGITEKDCKRAFPKKLEVK